MIDSRRKILITNLFLRGVSGTETHVRDLAIGLARFGHEVAVYSPDKLGVVADILLAKQIAVVRDPRDCPFVPDLIHGHHNFAILMSLVAFPTTPAVFVCHDALAWHDRPLMLPQVIGYFAVDRLCQERVAREANRPLDGVKIVGNSVDLSRFKARAHFATQPKRALILNHLARDSNFVPTVRKACEIHGIELTVRGAYSGNVTNTPETELLQYDLVFAKGRSAMEALTCGCAVLLCGVEGIGPAVTLDNFDELRTWNFGRRLLRQPHTVVAINNQMDEIKFAELPLLQNRARAELGLEKMIAQWISHYEQLRLTQDFLFKPSDMLDELQFVYQQLDQKHLLEYQCQWYKDNWRPKDRPA
jgi:hypothetical protein